MKKMMISFSLFLTIHYAAIAQNEVSLKLKNNSLLPASITLVSYTPGENGNSTKGLMLFSLCTKTIKFKPGTKIYLANKDQVNTVMSGARIDDQPPFLVVKKEDEGKSFNIH